MIYMVRLFVDNGELCQQRTGHGPADRDGGLHHHPRRDRSRPEVPSTQKDWKSGNIIF